MTNLSSTVLMYLHCTVQACQTNGFHIFTFLQLVMELLQHWLETGQLPCEESEDDLSIHYTNYFKFHKDEEDQYDHDITVRNYLV